MPKGTAHNVLAKDKSLIQNTRGILIAVCRGNTPTVMFVCFEIILYYVPYLVEEWFIQHEL